MDNRHIAVIGADGFVGSHMIMRLQHERTSFVLFDKRKHSLFDPRSLGSLLKGVSTVLHFAGANRSSEYELFHTNSIGTLGLLEGMKQYCPNARIIFASSSQVYSETSYGTSKRLAEGMIEWYTKLTSIKGAVFRISNIYGPGCRPFYNSVIATFCHLAKNNQVIEIHGDGKQTRDYIYVDDVIDAVWKSIVCKPKKSFDVFDICSGKKASINTVVRTIKSVFSGVLHVHYNKTASHEEKVGNITNKKAQSQLGWRPKTTLEQGLKYMFL